MELDIQNVKVSFPYQPYASQLSIMHRVITSLESGKNTLLESPTGSGKTLSLLCASLAWLNKKMKEIQSSGYQKSDGKASLDPQELSGIDDGTVDEKDVIQQLPDDDRSSQVHIPRIFYCTRTHKQITQIIRELRKTEYRNAKMTILASRQHTCINPNVKKSTNIVDACQDLFLSGSCEYDQPKKMSGLVKAVRHLDSHGPWDLEDLVSSLSSVPACPYFCSRKLMKTADIIFCPYNYLLDPMSRSAISLELQGDVIILDEAHNIEDVSREAASAKITENQLVSAKKDLECLREQGIEPEACSVLISMIDSMLRVMQLTLSRLVRAEESAQPTQVWTGREISGILATVGLAPEQVSKMESEFKKLSSTISDLNEKAGAERNEVNQPKRASGAIRLLQILFFVIGYMYRQDLQHIEDYRVVLTETVSYEKKFADSADETHSKSFDSSDLRDRPSDKWTGRKSAKSRYVESRELSLNFWCLNPAVVFSEIASQVHCVILMSGTLSPLDALAAELNVEFPIRLEASHVVSKEQLLVSTLAHGPKGTRLCATYENQNNYAFQDDVGAVVLNACQIVPGGVLCFLPSYGLMDKLVQRWETTGLLDELRHVKHVMVEPRSSVGLDAWVGEFYAAVDRAPSMEYPHLNEANQSFRDDDNGTSARHHNYSNHLTGAVAFAVCRGKVSEGLDFADAYGRLVIAVGIPYPALFNPQVQQKRNFNEAKFKQTVITSPKQSNLRISRTDKPVCSSSSESSGTQPILSPQSNRVLSGSEWYEAQAYRALNQALGRCIRHLNDWGAIIMVDARFAEQPARYMSGISRWIRSRAQHHTQWRTLAPQLQEFIKSRQTDKKIELEAQELDEIFND
ncbi:unnamed protein product [Calicophoron daubneyi]|uniref:Helicase ATP-binding domain-containing protein n=1 Tax=Calicophoron daubneyi TaxID=300641 RepID=A0AAV2TNR1_CALDB